MPDITMCKGGNCPMKERCYRHKAREGLYQSFFTDTPWTDKGCDYFWEMKEINK